MSKRIIEKTNSSVRYSYPENLKYASNVYSMGMLFWEISSGRIPFKSYPADGRLTSAIIHGKREVIIKGTPQEYIEIYKGMSI